MGSCDLGWWRLQDKPELFATLLTYDTRRNVVVAYGDGVSEWADGVWGPDLAAPGLVNPGMIYDEARGVTVLCGVASNEPDYWALSETWLWDGAQLRKVTPAHQPRARWFPQMSYDKARGVVVLFGGFAMEFGYTKYLTSTWEWDGTDWTERIPEWDGVSGDYPLTPPGRQDSAMIYDAVRLVSLVYGGVSIHGAISTAIWEWDGTAWTRRMPPDSPPNRYGHSMAWDSARQVAVLFGGQGDGVTTDTWEWDGVVWRKRTVTTAPPPRLESVGMTYDVARKTTIMFGGRWVTEWLHDMWEWNGAEH